MKTKLNTWLSTESYILTEEKVFQLMLNLLDLLSLLDKLDNYAMVIYEKVPIF